MFVKNFPAFKIKDSIVITDIHLGITRELWEKGITIPKQAKHLSDNVKNLMKRTSTKRIIILGDVKHKVPGTPKTEFSEINDFFFNLSEIPIIITKGNHDGAIEKITDNFSNIEVKNFHKIDKTIMTHGHMKIEDKYERIIIGHNHPLIKFKDSLGHLYFEEVWIKGKNKENSEIIIMPPFNELAGGHPVNEDMKLMGPVAKKIKLNTAKAFLLDGADIGFLNDLKL